GVAPPVVMWVKLKIVAPFAAFLNFSTVNPHIASVCEPLEKKYIHLWFPSNFFWNREVQASAYCKILFKRFKLQASDQEIVKGSVFSHLAQVGSFE
ncbi:hypothetical protein, partial [Thermococcus sp. ES12]|uniref:hypothetical protein n=1 Tax=Thermococcus sp. ES12 TaxID=1638246 RepID=UPI0019807C3D